MFTRKSDYTCPLSSIRILDGASTRFQAQINTRQKYRRQKSGLRLYKCDRKFLKNSKYFELPALVVSFLIYL